MIIFHLLYCRILSSIEQEPRSRERTYRSKATSNGSRSATWRCSCNGVSGQDFEVPVEIEVFKDYGTPLFEEYRPHFQVVHWPPITGYFICRKGFAFFFTCFWTASRSVSSLNFWRVQVINRVIEDRHLQPGFTSEALVGEHRHQLSLV